MKKLLTIIMVAAMLMTMSLSAFAVVPSDLSGAITDLGLSVPVVRNLEVPVNMQVDVGMTGSYAEGPVTAETHGYSENVNYRAIIYMTDVRALFNTLVGGVGVYFAGDAGLEARLANSIITGQFTIEIAYPESATVPANIVAGTALAGFNPQVANAFVETTPRTLVTLESGVKVLTITLAVKDNLRTSEMRANLATYLPDLAFTCEGVVLSVGENKVAGTITGQTKIYDDNTDPTPDDLICEINYAGKQGTDAGITGTEISETVTVVHLQQQQGGGGLNAGPSIPEVPEDDSGKAESATVTVVVGGEKENIKETAENGKVNVTEIEEQIADSREGFVLKGIYDAETGGNKLEGEVAVSGDKTVYAQWINVTVPSALNGDDHIKYIAGYPDGTVKPEANITREEVATIFFRLLKDDVRAELLTTENDFTDVEEGRWSNEAISTIANGGYINGYPNGTFRPEGKITRAELAAITARFLEKAVDGDKEFSDINGHWAEEYILSIANNEWIYGDGNGNFRPDDYITRAETITIINRILVRYVNEHGLAGNEIMWPDNAENAWYYFAVIEASNEHDHTRAENGYHEIWADAE